MNCKHGVLILFLVSLCLSCVDITRSRVQPSCDEVITYYLGDEERLKTASGPGGPWVHITNYLHPSLRSSSFSWRAVLGMNLCGPNYEVDLVVRSEGPTGLRVEFLLEHQGEETILATRDYEIPQLGENVGFNIEDMIEGKDALSGKGDVLVFRLTHIFGNASIEVYFDGAVGSYGNASISIRVID